MDELNQTPVNEGQESVTDSQQATENTTAEPVNAGAEGIATSKPVQDPQTNAAFAQMRRQTEQAQRDRDALIAEIYGQNGITTYEQYQQAKAQAEAEAKAQQMNVDPRFYQEVEGLKQQLSSYEQERQSMQRERTLSEQEKNLESDPHVGELFKQWKGEIKQLADQTGADYDVAFTLMLRNKIPDLLNSTKTSAEQDAVKRLINNAQSSPGALGQGAEKPSNSISNMSKSDFAKLQSEVLRGERKTL